MIEVSQEHSAIEGKITTTDPTQIAPDHGISISIKMGNPVRAVAMLHTLLRDVDMIDPQKISFHEATIIAFQVHDGLLALKLTGVFTDEGTRDAEIFISGVKRIEVDEGVVDSASITLPDGEVLSLVLSHNALELLVEWNDFANRSSCIMSYKACGERLSITLSLPKELS